jgi:hypothetical protein
MLFDQFNFLFYLSFLNHLFPCNCRSHIFIRLIPDKCVNPIFFCETFDNIVLMFLNPFSYIQSQPSINYPASFTCYDIYARLFIHSGESTLSYLRKPVFISTLQYPLLQQDCLLLKTTNINKKYKIDADLEKPYIITGIVWGKGEEQHLKGNIIQKKRHYRRRYEKDDKCR